VVIQCTKFEVDTTYIPKLVQPQCYIDCQLKVPLFILFYRKAGMLSPQNGLGFETKNYVLGLVASGLGLVDAVASTSTV